MSKNSFCLDILFNAGKRDTVIKIFLIFRLDTLEKREKRDSFYNEFFTESATPLNAGKHDFNVEIKIVLKSCYHIYANIGKQDYDC